MATINIGRLKPVFQGAYDNAQGYVVDDIVTYSGETYICILASTGNVPTNTTYWSKMASKGADGVDADLFSISGTAQGDLYYNNGSAIARLGAGTSGQALITNGTGANPSWGDVSGGLIQLQENASTTVVSTNSTSWTDSGFSATITPTSTSSKIWILCHIGSGTSAEGNNSAFQIRRNTTQILGNNNGSVFPGTWTGSDDYTSTRLANKFVQGVDSPNTTSAITYRLYWASNSSGNTVYLNRAGEVSTSSAEYGVGATNMVLVEIAG